MHIILGGTGDIGSVLASKLLEKGEAVTIISHDEKKKKEWEQKGATVAVVNVLEVDQLMEVTYGAQPGKGIGDLGVLYEMEQALSRMGIPSSVMHGAYYMSNWAFSADQVQQTGKLYSLYPADFKLPMVSPADIGEFGADLMLEPIAQTGNYYIEGPDQYSPGDVAEAFSEALGKPVEVVVIPEADWVSFLQQGGFSHEAAESMAAMTKITLEQDYKRPERPVKGKTTLKKFIEGVV